MAATLNNIKLLNKRYTSEQWKNGVLVDGQTIVPKLWPGEFGFNSTTGEVRANLSTASSNEENAVTFANATVVSFPVPQKSTTTSPDGKYIQAITFDKDESGSQLLLTEATLPSMTIAKDPSDTANGTFITSISIDTNDKHKLLYKTGNHPVSILTVTVPTTATNGADSQADTCIPVLTGATGSQDGHSHTVTFTTTEMPTKKYVDERVKEKTVKVSQSGSGNYVQSVTTTDDGKEIVVSNGTLPTCASSGSAGTLKATNASSATILGQVTISDSVSGGKTTHTISGTEKTIKGSQTSSGQGTITVSEANNQITITLDDSKYALAEDCSMAMVFKGTLSNEASDKATNATLSTASKTQVGDTYKVLRKGTYGGVEAQAGDMIICRQKGTGTGATYEWILIPSGDDVDKFLTDVEVGVGLVKTGSKLAPTIAHEDYGATTLTNLDGGFSSITSGDYKGYGVRGKVVTDMTFDTDGLGHVQTAALSDQLELATIAGAIQIAQDYESVTTVSHGTNTPITVTDNGANNDHAYVVSHNTVNRTNATGTAQSPGYGGSFNVITNIESTAEGHVSKVTTTQINIPASDNDYRAVKFTGKTNTYDTTTTAAETLLTSSSTTALNVVSGTNIKVSGNSSTGQLTIATLGTANNSTLGFVKLGTGTVLTGTTTSLTPVQEKTYPVGMDVNSKLHVYVPWENTDVYGHRSDLADTVFRFAVFKRDKGGHIVSVDDIAVLDGNYDID